MSHIISISFFDQVRHTVESKKTTKQELLDLLEKLIDLSAQLTIAEQINRLRHIHSWYDDNKVCMELQHEIVLRLKKGRR